MARRYDLQDVLQLDRAAISRAAFLRRTGSSVLGLSMLGLVACGDDDDDDQASSGGGAPKDVGGTIKYLGWQGYDDKKAVEPITSKGVKLSAEYITTNDDIVTKLRGGAQGSLDVVTPFVGYIPALVAGDLIEELDYGKLPSTDTFFPEFVEIAKQFGEGKTYCAPLVWGDTPMIVRPDQLGELPKSWLDLRDPKYKGKLMTLDDVYGNIVIISRALFGPDNASEITRSQLDEVVQVWKEIKPNIVTIAPSFGDAADVMARGDAPGMIQGWRFMEQQLKAKDVEVAAHMPEEGSYAWTDTYAIPTDAPNPDAAYAFIEAMISARGNALVGAATGSGVTNEAARVNLPGDQKDLYPYDNIGTFFAEDAGFYALPLEPEGDYVAYDEWTKAWEEIKAA